jgi:hypothetical protein
MTTLLALGPDKALGPIKAENDRLEQLDATKGTDETEGWRIGTPIRKGKKKQEQIGIVIQVVSKNDVSNEYPDAYIWVLYENGDIDSPGRGKKDILKFRKAYKKAYKDGLGDRSLDITDKQLIDAWCACPLPPPPFSRAARFRRQSHADRRRVRLSRRNKQNPQHPIDTMCVPIPAPPTKTTAAAADAAQDSTYAVTSSAAHALSLRAAASSAIRNLRHMGAQPFERPHSRLQTATVLLAAARHAPPS